MKAALRNGPKKVELIEMEKPAPLADEVLVAVKSCGICGSDIVRIQQDDPKWDKVVLGHEFAGVIVAVGDAVEAEQSLVTLESDKATMEVPAPAAGVIAELRVQLDDTVSEGDIVVVLDAADEVETTSSETGQKPEPAAVKAEAPKTITDKMNVKNNRIT